MFKWFNNLKISARIISGFFLIVAISCVIGVVGIMNLDSVQSSYEADFLNVAQSLEYLEVISAKFQQVRVNVVGYGMIDFNDQDTKDYYISRIETHKTNIADNIANTAAC